jgi:hypothetical protein
MDWVASFNRKRQAAHLFEAGSERSASPDHPDNHPDVQLFIVAAWDKILPR